MTVTEVFLNLFQFRSEFCFVSYAEYNVQDLSMLEKFSRFFNVGRNIDAAVRYQKIPAVLSAFFHLFHIYSTLELR